MNQQNNEMNHDRLGGVMLVIGCLIFLALLTYLFNHILLAPPTARVSSISGETRLVIPISHDNHYRIRGTINGVSVMFLVDTGASSVAMPASVAAAAGLRKLQEAVANTAGGQTRSHTTLIHELTFGPLSIANVNGVIVPGMPDDVVLLGMNVLQYFDISINNEELEIVVKSN